MIRESSPRSSWDLQTHISGCHDRNRILYSQVYVQSTETDAVCVRAKKLDIPVLTDYLGVDHVSHEQWSATAERIAGRKS
jgi:hypothetical protein